MARNAKHDMDNGHFSGLNIINTTSYAEGLSEGPISQKEDCLENAK